MLDFNTKKAVLRGLRAKRNKNKALWLPCVIAELCVKLWYTLLTGLDLALSGKNGKLFGFISTETRTGKRRQDDIIYVKKPFLGRMLSAVLAVSLALMFMPEIVPEMDISIKASAVMPTATVPVEENGTIVDYYRNPDNLSEVFKKDEFDAAVAYQVASPKYDVGYGALKLSWSAGTVEISKISNYHIDIFSVGSGEVLNGGGNGEDRPRTATTYDAAGLSPNTEVGAIIKPITVIKKYLYTEPLIPGDPGNVTPMNDTYTVEGKETVITSLGLLDASFNAPVVTLTNSLGDTVDQCTTDKKPVINWTQEKQVNGKDIDANKPATGYNIYTYDVDTGKFSVKTLVSETAVSQSVSELVAGHHYQFFVEAYRYVFWDGAEPKNFNSSAKGIISSSREFINSDNSTKLNSSYYSNNAKDLYVAPVAPVIRASEQTATKSISLSWTPSAGKYDGVELYRSIGEINPKNIEEVANGTYTFAEWLKIQVSDSSNSYKLTAVGKTDYKSFENTETDPSKNIAEGVQYYYYAVPYIMKSDNVTKIYGAPGSCAAILDLKLSRTNLEITKGDGKNTLSWAKVPNADGYELEITQLSKYDPDTGKIVPITSPATVTRQIDSGNTTTFQHNDLYNGEQYRYRVTPYVWIETRTGTKPFYGEPSDPRTVTVGFNLDTPENVTADGSKDGQVTVKWDPVNDATGYVLYSYNHTTNEKKEFRTTKTTYTQTNLSNNNVVEYYVVAYKNVTGDDGVQTIPSSPSNHVTVKVGKDLNMPQDMKVTTKDGENTVTWSQVTGAEGYILYYKKSTDSVWKTFDVTKPNFTHPGLLNGEKWDYKTVAYKTVNGEKVLSDESIVVSIIVGVPIDAPKDFTGKASDGKIELTWTAVKGAEGYIVHITGSNGTKQTVDVSKTSYTHAGVKNGETYTYYLQAYKTVNGERVYSDDSYSAANRVTLTVGDYLETPKDFNAVTSDGVVNVSWTAAKGAEGYILYAYGPGGKLYQYDLSKTKFDHIGLNNGEKWTYYVVAYKTINGIKSYSEPSNSKTVTVGVSLNAAIDLTATAGSRQIDLTWSAVKGAEGYVVYLYNQSSMEFEPITVVSGTKYSHIGLKNGKKYTYMVAPFKTINGERFFGDFSISVSAIPTTGSITDIDHELTVKGTTPYGISHSVYISANANHGAFDESVDVYFTTNRESTNEVKDVLKHYANGLKSFIIYPFDISVYQENTRIHVKPNDGYTVTVTMPIPDRLIAYRDYLTVVHIGEATTTNSEANEEILDPSTALVEDWIKTPDSRLQVLPCAVLDIDNVWCIQFVCTEFSPYALVIYKDHLDDVSAGGGIIGGSFAGTFNSGILLFTSLPDILPNNKKLKVIAKSKRYRIVKKG